MGMKLRINRRIITNLKGETFAVYDLEEKKWWGWKEFQNYTLKEDYERFVKLCKNFQMNVKMEKVGDWETRPEL